MLKKFEEFSLPKLEQKVLEFWDTNQIFQKSLKNRAKRKKFVFYEGPPTANGRPGIHHILARAFKDVIPRYRTMAGAYVPRRGGWDTHGLPVELEVEKKLGLTSKRDIERYGIEKFNAKCRESVWQYRTEWESLTRRIGFWLDMRDPYITYENSYVESLWAILKEIAKKKLLYKGHKVVPWCPRCGTTLSSHELALGYREVEETSVYLKFRLKKGQKFGGGFTTDGRTFILSWTTTPWTLPGNVALAIAPNVEYSLVAVGDGATRETYILATPRLSILPEPREIQGTVKGRDLVGLEYEPLFDIKPLNTKTSYKVYPAKFVTTVDGTGVVHTAVMYGEDDYNLGKEVGLPQVHTVDLQGRFLKDVPGLAGLYAKDHGTEGKILKVLQTNGNLLRTEPYKHDYPFCWRCSTPLLYYARDSWFIAMSRLRPALLRENKKVKWVPESVRDGRFGEWLREVKDWAISRERYWGTPLPIWQCEKCDRIHVVGSYQELSDLQGGPANRYILMRHGESISNLKNEINARAKDKNEFALTLRGRVEAEKAAKALKKEKIDLIVASDFRRTRETAEIVAKAVGASKVLLDKRFREINTGIFEGCHAKEYREFFSSYLEVFTKRPPKGEALRDLVARSFEGLQELEKRHKGKTILIVSHEYPIWALETAMRGWSMEQSIREKEARGEDFIATAGWRPVPALRLPRGAEHFADPHKPFVDSVAFPCSCGGTMRRIPEVVDVWFDSGAMPFAQNHWPFQKTAIDFPADYISEAVDQTRGWFYTLLAEAVALGKPAPFRNVICLGLIMDKNGQKMSKSKGNIVDPWAMIEKYGADTVRWHLFTVNPPGEPKKFDEADLGKTLRQFILMLYNSFVFYETYAVKPGNPSLPPKTKNILDRWILARLVDTTVAATRGLASYDIGGAARVLELFAQDLSRWYIRRSRRRLQKPESAADQEAVSRTLGYALLNLAGLLAPFMPFFSEALYRSIVKEGGRHTLPESVHLTDWPRVPKTFADPKLLKAMEEVRTFAGLGLAKRAEVGIKVRQPLGMFRIKTKDPYLLHSKELLDLLRDEVNVKDAHVDNDIRRPVELDIRLSQSLKEEGYVRELVRMVQDLRQDGKLEPKDRVVVRLEIPKELLRVIETHEAFLKTEVNARSVEYRRSPKFTIELETKLDASPLAKDKGEGWPVWIGLQKVS